MARETIFVVEDDLHIQQLIKYNLESEGYRVFLFTNGEELLDHLQSAVPGLFLLDIMLPGIDGQELCRKIRQTYSLTDIPVIMLTAKGEEFDKVLGLELGADDYITKPFSVRELIARIKTVLRRSSSGSEPKNTQNLINYAGILIDTPARKVYKNNKLIEMPFKEFELLKMLVLNKGKVLSREILLEKIWGFDYFGETRTVDVHIRYLRMKIEDDCSKPVYIETVRGIGYRFGSNIGSW